MSRIFSTEGPVWQALNVISDIFVLSIIWLCCCVPVITAGSATTALYDSAVRCIRYKHPNPYKRYFRTFKNELKTSIPVTLVWLVIMATGFVSLDFLQVMSETAEWAKTLMMIYYVLMVIPLGTVCWIFPVLSRFTYSFSALNTTAFRLAMGNLPRTLIMVLITVVTVQISAQLILPAFFLPAIMMLLWSIFTESVFAKLGGGLTKVGTEPDKE